MDTDARKAEEAKFHDLVRDKNSPQYQRLTSNRKFYSITRDSAAFTEQWLDKHCPGKKVLDFCCGEGELALKLAHKGANAFGIDISPFSIEQAQKKATAQNISDKTSFAVMDAESMTFENNFFDVIVCHGVLHHLDIKKAWPELARVLKPDGHILCVEPLAYNPIFQLYRKLTPHLRTEWEAHHILKTEDIFESKKYFETIDLRFFHMFSLAAVPFRNTVLFKPVLGILESLDRFVLGLPGIKWWAWQVTFILSNPKKNA